MMRVWLALWLAGASAFAAENAGLKAYEETLFKLVRSRCTHCHDGRQKDDGISGPGFAVPDLALSYSRIRKYVRFDSIGESYLVKKGGNLHCLKNYGFNCNTERAEIAQTIEAWWEQGEKSNQAPIIESPTVAVGKPAVPTKFSWSLAKISGDPDLRLEIDVQQFQIGKDAARGAYRFRQPRLVGASDAYHVRTLRFVVNGKEQTTADMFHSVDRTVSSSAVLSPLTAIVLRENAEGDEIAVRFDGFARAEEPKCHDVALFEKDILPVMVARDCFSCHGGGPEKAVGEAKAREHWDMNGGSEALCQGVKQRCDREDPNVSAFTLYSLEGNHRHPRVIPFAYELEPEFSKWVSTELGERKSVLTRSTAPPLEEE